MNSVRKRVAFLGVVVPCVLIFLGMNAEVFSPTGALYGQVTYNGKPLDRGFVLFYPTDEKSSDWAVGPIDKDGSYRIEPKWRHISGRTQFRICIVPRKGKPATHMDVPHEGSDSRAVSVPLNSTSSDAHSLVALDVGFPDKYTNIATSGLQISLSREPARIDIDMKD